MEEAAIQQIKVEVGNGKLKIIAGAFEYNSQAVGYEIDLKGVLSWYDATFGTTNGPTIEEIRHQLQEIYYRPKLRRKKKATTLGEDSSHFEVAEALRKDRHFIALARSKELLLYQDGVYARNAEGIAASLVEGIKGRTSTNGFVSEVLGHLTRKGLKEIEEFDADLTKVNLQNGVLNLKTFEVSPHSPDYLSLTKLKMKYDRNTRCPNIIGFIDEAHDNAVDKLHDVDFVAACLYNRQIKKWKLDIGDTDSGKTTYQQLVEKALGSENVCHISPQELETDKFIAYNAVGKAAIMYGDVDKKSLDKSTKFKTTTGEDRISVQRKHGQPFDAGIRAKGFFAANVIPETKDESDAFFNRWLIEPWPFIFKDDGKYTKDESGHLVKVNDTKKNPFLIDLLTTEEEISGLLNVCLRRLPSIARLKSIPNSPGIEETRLIWMVGSDFVRLFLHETVRKEPEGEKQRQPLYLEYHQWCGRKGITPETQRTFNNRVENVLGAKKLDTTRDKEDVQLWRGIVWRKNMLEKPPVPPVPPGQGQLTDGTGANSNIFSLAEQEWDEIKAAFGGPHGGKGARP
jgi:putative DNA primase/helicase